MKPIINRGRNLDAVINPKNYPPFSKILDKQMFEAVWRKNPNWIFANMAHAAYCDFAYIKKLLKNLGAKEIKFYESQPDDQGLIRGREAFLAIWKDKAILSFRGTESSDPLRYKLSEKFVHKIKKIFHIDIPAEIKIPFPVDIFDDANFFATQFNQCLNGPAQNSHPELEIEVHSGFYNATCELLPTIIKDIENLQNIDPDSLFVTGHSLGAAMAVIAAMVYPFDQVVTFGEPAVGNYIEKVLEKPRHIRYVNGEDPVTKIVPEKLYKHHGILVQIEDDDGPDIRFDHSIINYSEILENIEHEPHRFKNKRRYRKDR